MTWYNRTINTMNIKVNVVSESDISVRGHGVHTAYVEMVKSLRERSDCTVITNQFFKKVDADVTHIHTVGLHSWTKLLWGSGPKVVSAHIVPDSLIGSFALAGMWRPLAKLYMKLFYAHADRVLAVSTMVADTLTHELHIAPEKVEILYNSIDTSQYKPDEYTKRDARQKLGISQDSFVVMGNGQVQPRKRFDTFVHCAKQLPDLTFVWVGGIPFKYVGAQYQEMKKLIEEIPSNMKVTGVIELEDVKQYFGAADIFVLPAEQENHPMAVIEAAAAGLPIILRDILEYDDTFGQDIMRAKDNQAFIEAIESLRSNESLRDEYRQKSAGIARRFDSHESAARLIDIYMQLLTDRQPVSHKEKRP